MGNRKSALLGKLVCEGDAQVKAPGALYVFCIHVARMSSLVPRYLVSLGCIKPLCDLLTVMDSKIVQVALNGLENIHRLGEQESKRSGSGVNPYCGLIEEAYGRSSP